MIIRLEFTPNKSPRFPWALRLCQQIPTYKKTNEGGLEIHSVELHIVAHETIFALKKALGSRENVACYVDGTLVDGERLSEIVWEARKRENMDRWIEQQTRHARARALFHKDPDEAFLARLKKYGLIGNPN